MRNRLDRRARNNDHPFEMRKPFFDPNLKIAFRRFMNIDADEVLGFCFVQQPGHTPNIGAHQDGDFLLRLLLAEIQLRGADHIRGRGNF